MRVRVYDKKTNTYSKSEVYAIINSGYYEKQLVLTLDDMGMCLMFCDYLSLLIQFCLIDHMNG